MENLTAKQLKERINNAVELIEKHEVVIVLIRWYWSGMSRNGTVIVAFENTSKRVDYERNSGAWRPADANVKSFYTNSRKFWAMQEVLEILEDRIAKKQYN